MTGACMPEVSSNCILRSVFLEPFVKVGVAKRCGGIGYLVRVRSDKRDGRKLR